MKEELVILPTEEKWVFDNGEFSPIMKGLKPYVSGKSLKREPAFAAILIEGKSEVQVIAEVDYKKSKLEEKEIWLKNPIRVSILIRFGKDTLQGIRYTTFRKLIIHKTADYL